MYGAGGAAAVLLRPMPGRYSISAACVLVIACFAVSIRPIPSLRRFPSSLRSPRSCLPPCPLVPVLFVPPCLVDWLDGMLWRLRAAGRLAYRVGVGGGACLGMRRRAVFCGWRVVRACLGLVPSGRIVSVPSVSSVFCFRLVLGPFLFAPCLLRFYGSYAVSSRLSARVLSRIALLPVPSDKIGGAWFELLRRWRWSHVCDAAGARAGDVVCAGLLVAVFFLFPHPLSPVLLSFSSSLFRPAPPLSPALLRFACLGLVPRPPGRGMCGLRGRSVAVACGRRVGGVRSSRVCVCVGCVLGWRSWSWRACDVVYLIHRIHVFGIGVPP